ncbi:MAG: flippase [Halobacteriaceae archaeon]
MCADATGESVADDAVVTDDEQQDQGTRSTADEPADRVEELGFDLRDLESVTHGALITVAGLLLQKALLFGANLLLTRGLGVSAYGVYAFGQRLVMMIRGVASLGVGAALVRFIPAAADDPGRRNRVLGLATVTTLLASTAAAILIAVFAPAINRITLGEPAFPAVLRLFAVALPLYALLGVTASSFRGLERPAEQALIARVGRPGARVVGVGVPLLFGAAVAGVVVGQVVATAIAMGAAALLLLRRTDLRPSVPRTEEVREYFRYALPVAASTVGRLLRSRVDVLLVGFLLTAGAAGVYNVALFLTGFITLPLLAFNQLLPPVASRLYADDRVDQVDEVYSTVTRLVFTGALYVAAVEVTYRGELLGLFGAEFQRGGPVMVAFALGQLVHAGVGATGWLLLMTDNQYLEAANNWILGVLNVTLSYLLVLRFGLIGAAVGTAGSLAVMNVARVTQLRYVEGLFAFDRTFLKPVAAGLALVGTLLVADAALEGPRLLVAGSLAGAVVYLAALYALGVEPADRALLASLVAEYVDDAS